MFLQHKWKNKLTFFWPNKCFTLLIVATLKVKLITKVFLAERKENGIFHSDFEILLCHGINVDWHH
jgi:hypothetical protein